MSGFDVTVESIADQLTAVNALVTEAEKVRGNAAKVLAEAGAEALAVDVTIPASTMPAMGKENFSITKPKDEDGKVTPHVTFQLVDLAIFAKSISEWAENLFDEQRSTILKGKATGDSEAALEERYGKAVKMLEAMLTVGGPDAMGVLELTDVEKVRAEVKPFRKRGGARKSTSASPTATPSRKAGSKFARYYRKFEDGSVKDQPDSQNLLSSVAWYHGADLMGIPGEGPKYDGKGVPVEDLEAHLRKNGIDSPQGKPWEYKSTTGVIYGMRTDDGNPAEASEDVAEEE
jgi:hypothetical protein